MMTCLTCPKEHAVLARDSPSCVCVSNQNFAPNLSGHGQPGCVGVARMESASLTELADFVLELFEKSRFPPGSVLCIGSASYLHRVGLTIYTMDWCKILNDLSSEIKGIQICPLVPVLNNSIPSSLAGDLIALAYWLIRRYEGSTLGLLHAWSHLAGRVAELTHVGPSLLRG